MVFHLGIALVEHAVEVAVYFIRTFHFLTGQRVLVQHIGLVAEDGGDEHDNVRRATAVGGDVEHEVLHLRIVLGFLQRIDEGYQPVAGIIGNGRPGAFALIELTPASVVAYKAVEPAIGRGSLLVVFHTCAQFLGTQLRQLEANFPTVSHHLGHILIFRTVAVEFCLFGFLDATHFRPEGGSPIHCADHRHVGIGMAAVVQQIAQRSGTGYIFVHIL